MKVTQSCPTLCDPMSYTVHGILQARILEWVAFSFSRGVSQPRDQTQVSRTADSFFAISATTKKPLKTQWSQKKKKRGDDFLSIMHHPRPSNHILFLRLGQDSDLNIPSTFVSVGMDTHLFVVCLLNVSHLPVLDLKDKPQYKFLCICVLDSSCK